jgi:putative tricarboxylic transport membrane protein
MARTLLVAFTMVLGVGIAPVWAQPFPSGPIEIIAPASPGGGWDSTARVVQAVLVSQSLVKGPVNVVNRPGAGGQVGWSYLNEHKGNPHFLAMNSNQLFPRQLTGQSKMKFEDFAPLARLTAEYIVLSVRADSPYKTGKQFMEALKVDPTKHSIGIGSGLASSDHVSTLRAAKSAGVDIKRVKIVVFSSGGDQMTAILGGDVDAVATGLSESIEQAKAGKLRIIAITAPKRVEGDGSEVPTWAEMGIDGTFFHWRGIMGPGGLTPEQVAAWDRLLSQMVQSAAWKTEIEKRGWSDAYIGSKAFFDFLKQDRASVETVLKEIGFIKQ